MYEIIGKCISMLERIILSILMVCFATFIVKSILGGVEDYLVSINDSIDPSSLVASATASINLGILSTIIFLIYYLVFFFNIITTGLYKITSFVVSKLHEVLIVEFIRNLFLNGPDFKGYGFWAGRPPEDICGEMTRARVKHWTSNKDNEEECKLLIENGIQGYVVILQLILLSILIFKYIDRLWEKIKKDKLKPKLKEDEKLTSKKKKITRSLSEKITRSLSEGSFN